jgi:FtsP/CotA-like multicopper oxidase with cupredoxin domain
VVEVSVGPALADATVVRWPAAVPLPERAASEEIVLELDVRNGMHGLEWLINDQAHSDALLFHRPQGTTASIVIFNRAGPEHPFHLHGQFFEIVRRNGAAVVGEPGLKDTVLIPGLESVELRAYLDNPGLWMAHCHILEHAELGMMSQFEVSAP